MHLHFEKNANTTCDCTILSLSWMGKVPDELPEDEGWKLNRTNYYEEGWIAIGNVRGIVGVTFTTSHCNKAVECPARTNYNLRGHRSEVILVKWNEPYQKLASCDSSGIIFVWIKYEGRWSIELINDRNTRVTHFSWSHDGRMALICYQDGFVLVGSVAGQRYWSSMLSLDCTIVCGIWAPDDQQVYFGTSNGQIIVMDVHGAMVSQVTIAHQIPVLNMAWSCEKFKMEEGDDSKDNSNCVLAVSLENGVLFLMKHFDDIAPIQIHTGLTSLCLEWSNSQELLCVAGTVPNTEYTNMVKIYTDTGQLLYASLIPHSGSPVTALTWGHNDKRIFIATGLVIHIAWVSMRIASLQLLASLKIYERLNSVSQLPSLSLPVRIQQIVSKLFSHTIKCCIPEGSSLRQFVSKAPKVYLHCTMLRHDDDLAANCYTLYLEYLGGLVPLLKGKRTSKIKPEFVIFDPEAKDVNCENLNLSALHHWHDKDESDPEEMLIFSSPRPHRKHRLFRHQIHSSPVPGYLDTLPEDFRLAELTSNIWGTKFRIHGVSNYLASNLGQITFKTSLLHLQPRQMTLLIASDTTQGPSDALLSSVLLDDEDEQEPVQNIPPIAPFSHARCRHLESRNVNCRNQRQSCSTTSNRYHESDSDSRRASGNLSCPNSPGPRANATSHHNHPDGFMTRSSFKDCECVNEVDEQGDKSRRGVVRSCSVGYLDLVESGGAHNNRLVLTRNVKSPRLIHCGKSRSLDSSDVRLGESELPKLPAIKKITAPHSSPTSPIVKKKKNLSASALRKRLLNSPLLMRKVRRARADNDYQDLESFQKAQLRNKIEIASKRREFIMYNKAPFWNENSQVYQLDFGGRVTQESAKNFQVEFRGKQVLQFGRIDGNAFTLDFQYPFSAVQAFAVALANKTQRLK
ncbi:unnamed protein product [Bemisia tabaci]|uniref:Tubby-related protein 4 n=1 Tax=Bemisia tabaci TaxID=7038 RepID=A0A9P0F373_BEMTA|nr:unnamed protein product [Bemisia tabaci]